MALAPAAGLVELAELTAAMLVSPALLDALVLAKLVMQVVRMEVLVVLAALVALGLAVLVVLLLLLVLVMLVMVLTDRSTSPRPTRTENFFWPKAWGDRLEKVLGVIFFFAKNPTKNITPS